jgi:hypothetical protein
MILHWMRGAVHYATNSHRHRQGVRCWPIAVFRFRQAKADVECWIA